MTFYLQKYKRIGPGNILMKLHMHHHSTVKYKFHEIPSIARTGKLIDILKAKGQ